MLEFTETLLKRVRQLKADAEVLVLGNRITSMEQYKHLMGRIVGISFVEAEIHKLLKQNPDD